MHMHTHIDSLRCAPVRRRSTRSTSYNDNTNNNNNNNNNDNDNTNTNTTNTYAKMLQINHTT